MLFALVMFSIPVVVEATPEVVCKLAAETVPAVRVVFAAVNLVAVVPSPSSQPPVQVPMVVVTLATTPSTIAFTGMQDEQTVVVAPEVERLTIPPSAEKNTGPPPLLPASSS